MSVITFLSGDLFIVRVIKYLSTNPANKWVNSYEFRAQEGATEAALLNLATALESFEIAIHKEVVQFDRIIISTWEADSKPYDPAAFLVVPLTSHGDVGMVGDNLPLDKCLSVARVPLSGRVGHIFYRGVLNEADTSAPAGKSILNDVLGVQGIIDDALTSSELDAYIHFEDDVPLRMVMVDKTGETVRSVGNLRVKGVATLPTDHAWFNRTTSP